MFKLSDKRTVNFDVDDTLIMWECDPDDPTVLYIDGLKCRPHLKHIELLKNLKAIGWNIVIWSQGGADHAANVIKHLELEKYVDVVMSKPEMIVDDLPWDAQYIKRKYLDE